MNRNLLIRTTKNGLEHYAEVATAPTEKLAQHFDAMVATITALRGAPDSFLPARSSGCHATWNSRDDHEAELCIIIDMGE